MSAPGISLIGIRFALVCAGLAFWPRAPRRDRAALDGPDEFRMIFDAFRHRPREGLQGLESSSGSRRDGALVGELIGTILMVLGAMS
jgi:hypothetical protein